MANESISADAPAAPKLPTISHLLLEAPLYANFAFIDDPETRRTLSSLRRDSVQLDAHCVQCKRSSVFKTMRNVGSGARGGVVDVTWMLKNGDWILELHCVRNPLHIYRYYLAIESAELQKIGQWPSLEDIAGADIEKYRPQLKGYFRELKVATGLASHGVGIGSFVYLRRIFERLIYQHHDELSSPIDGFGTMRMDERINSLKAVLPPALVKNKATYAILSKGLHELDEETCQLYFPVVRSAIIGILEQDFQKREADKAEAALAHEIAEINRQLKG